MGPAMHSQVAVARVAAAGAAPRGPGRATHPSLHTQPTMGSILKYVPLEFVGAAPNLKLQRRFSKWQSTLGERGGMQGSSWH